MLNVLALDIVLQKKRNEMSMEKRKLNMMNCERNLLRHTIFIFISPSTTESTPQQSFKYCHCSRIWITFACGLIICNVYCCVWRRQTLYAQQHTLQLTALVGVNSAEKMMMTKIFSSMTTMLPSAEPKSAQTVEGGWLPLNVRRTLSNLDWLTRGPFVSCHGEI